MRRRIHIETEPAGESVGTAAAGAPAAGADGDTGMTPAAEAEITALEDRVTEQEALIATLEARVAELETLVTERDTQVETERNQYLRTLADFQNFRRRNEEQRGELVQFAAREFVLGLLPVLDNFERALAAADKNQSYESLIGGVALTLRQLQEFLKKSGVEAIEAVGKEFDPNFHEAVARVDGSDLPENTVVDEMQRGYTMHNRVLRPAMVRVAKSE